MKGLAYMALKQMKAIAERFSVHKNYQADKIKNFINNNFSLGSGEYSLIMQLINQGRNCNGVSFPSGEYLSEKLGKSRPRIMQIVKQLVKKGLLIVEKVRQGESFHNFYIIPTVGYMQKVLDGMFEALKTGADILKEAYDELASKTKRAAERFKRPFKRPTRTEPTPDWFEDPETYYKRPTSDTTDDEAKKRAIEEKLRKMRQRG